MARQDIVDKALPLIVGADKVPGVAPVAKYVDIALDLYSHLKGHREVELTITGDGTDEYSLGADWVDGFSVVRQVTRWDSNDTNSAPTVLESHEYQVEERLPAAAASQIRFLGYSPSSSDRVVVTHTASEIIGETAGTTSVPAAYDTGLAYMAAAALLRASAMGVMAIVSQATDDDLLGTSNSSRAGEYRRMADDYDKLADQLLGIDRDSAGAGGGRPVLLTVRALPLRRRGRRSLTHGSSYDPGRN